MVRCALFKDIFPIFVDSLEERLDLVEIFVKDESLRQMLREELMKKMPDFYRMAKKFQRHKATLQVSVTHQFVVIDLKYFNKTFTFVITNVNC